MAHILLVEDDSDIMRINSSFLEKEGYTEFRKEFE